MNKPNQPSTPIPVSAPANENKPLHINLIVHPENKGWILEKFALRLAENLPLWNVQAEISEGPSENADINHWMLYLHCEGRCPAHNTMLITHVDRPNKLRHIAQNIQFIDMGICESRMTVNDLERWGVDAKKLCYVIPGHDGLVKPKRIVIGMTSRVYEDGRKREKMLVEIAQRMSFEPFHFEIFGPGWEAVIRQLEAAGATVKYDPGSNDFNADYKRILQAIPNFDYYLYMGMDEGSTGFLDALASGVATIVTSQGFHLDIPNGITHPFTEQHELHQILVEISHQRQMRIASVQNLTWKDYAQKHAIIWRAILDQQINNLPQLLHGDLTDQPVLPKTTVLQKLWRDIRFFSIPLQKRIQKLLKKYDTIDKRK